MYSMILPIHTVSNILLTTGHSQKYGCNLQDTDRSGLMIHDPFFKDDQSNLSTKEPTHLECVLTLFIHCFGVMALTGWGFRPVWATEAAALALVTASETYV